MSAKFYLSTVLASALVAAYAAPLESIPSEEPTTTTAKPVVTTNPQATYDLSQRYADDAEFWIGFERTPLFSAGFRDLAISDYQYQANEGRVLLPMTSANDTTAYGVTLGFTKRSWDLIWPSFEINMGSMNGAGVFGFGLGWKTPVVRIDRLIVSLMPMVQFSNFSMSFDDVRQVKGFTAPVELSQDKSKMVIQNGDNLSLSIYSFSYSASLDAQMRLGQSWGLYGRAGWMQGSFGKPSLELNKDDTTSESSGTIEFDNPAFLENVDTARIPAKNFDPQLKFEGWRISGGFQFTF